MYHAGLIYTDVLAVKPHLAPSIAPSEWLERKNYRYEWHVVLVLAACYALSFVARQIFSLLVGPIKHDSPFVTTTDFKKQPDASGWNPKPCLAR
jgi:hypothetical protein